MLYLFRRWLARPASPKNTLVLSVGLFVVVWSWAMLFTYALLMTGLLPYTPPLASYSLPVLILSALLAAIVEELVFRIIPLTLALRRWGLGDKTLLTLLGTSIVFGVIHGGILNLPAQGITGFVLFGVLFIKFSESGTRVTYAGIIVMILHFLFDVLCYLVLLASR